MRLGRQRLLASLGLIGLLVLVGAGVSVALSGWPTSGTDPAPARATPSVAPAVSGAPGGQAQRIEIARLGIDLQIIEGDGIDAPLDRVAHYPGSGWPGGGTNIYLYGHARAGLLLPLWQAEVGDRILLTLVDGSLWEYQVARIVPDAPWDAIDYLDPTPIEQLTLQTSTSEEPSDPRFIVIAYPSP